MNVWQPNSRMSERRKRMAPIDRRKQESCEKYEPPELAPLGDLTKLTLGGGRDFVESDRAFSFSIMARSALDDADLVRSGNEEPANAD